jgi:hypothetical protein
VLALVPSPSDQTGWILRLGEKRRAPRIGQTTLRFGQPRTPTRMYVMFASQSIRTDREADDGHPSERRLPCAGCFQNLPVVRSASSTSARRISKAVLLCSSQADVLACCPAMGGAGDRRWHPDSG